MTQILLLTFGLLCLAIGAGFVTGSWPTIVVGILGLVALNLLLDAIEGPRG